MGGTDGPSYGHILRDFGILGAAGCCRRALVVRNLIDPTVRNVCVKAGATHGVSIEGVQNARRGAVKITVSNNTNMPYAGTAPTNGFRIVGGVVVGGNRQRRGADRRPSPTVTVAVLGSFNNFLSGVSQGSGGKNVSIKGWTDFAIRDFDSPQRQR